MSFQIIRKVTFRGEVQERTLEVPGETLRIGRGVSNELRLEDLSVSLNHAEIRRDEQGRHIVRDTSQAQATYVNRAPVEVAALHHGDVIRIQHYLLSVSQPNLSEPLVLAVEDAPKAQVEPSLALMPKLQLSAGRWTRWPIAAVLTGLVLAGSVLALALGQREVFMPGAVSVKHSKFANQCEVCHASVKPVWSFVDNAACQTCHRSDILSPAHFKQEVALSPFPLCASCHLEHKGQKVLADVPDLKCVQCHGDLKAKDQSVPGIAAVRSFTNDHPEFAISRLHQDRAAPPLRVRLDDKTQLKDDGRLKLNHALHLELDKDYLEAMGFKPLTCTECHRTDIEGRYMQSITFVRDCMRCHVADLEFDLRLPGRSVTHGREPEAVRQQLEEIYSGVYFKAHPEEAKKPERIGGIQGRQLGGPPQTVHERYVMDRLAEAEKVLFSPKVRRCLKCHSVEPPMSDQPTTASENGVGASSALPSPGLFRIARVNVAVRWLPYSRFDHQAHFALPEIKERGKGNWCVACHENAPASKKTEDVLLPSIGLCRNCHLEPAGAQASCKSCHEFHVPKLPAHFTSVPYQSDPKLASP